MFLQIIKSVECPVEGCPARAKKNGKIKRAFHVLTLKVEGGHIA